VPRDADELDELESWLREPDEPPRYAPLPELDDEPLELRDPDEPPE